MRVVFLLPISDSSESACSNEEGFSLVEMLVALAILGTIGTLMSSFAVQLRQLDGRSKEIAFENELNAVLDHVVGLIGSAVSQPFQIAPGQPAKIFIGQSDKVRLVANSRVSSLSSGLRDIELFATQNLDASDQLLQQNAFLSPSSSDTVAAADPVTLIGKFSEFSFQFASGPDLDWAERWEKISQLPYAVKISISYRVNGKEKSLVRTTRLLNSLN